ncbi:MAG: DUF6512 family protein [Erysipelotrichaceae bacterium]|nr:DUF6512 family protein [Erysipelotrichaceae bacterium]
MILMITILEFLMGSCFHFVYDYFPCFPLSLLFPINESIFEHLKLSLYPMIFVDIYLYFKYYKQDKRILFPYLVGLLTSMLSIAMIYYFYHIGLNITNLWIDIGLLFVALLIGNGFTYLAYNDGWYLNLYVTIVIFVVIIILISYWTYYPLNLPIFIS